MLIHKKTLGVLSAVYVEGNFQREREACFKYFPDLNRDEWWEIPLKSPLGQQVDKMYPDFIPQVNSKGELIGIKPLWQENKVLTKAEKRAHIATLCKERGYAKGARLMDCARPAGAFSFIDFGADLSAFVKI